MAKVGALTATSAAAAGSTSKEAARLRSRPQIHILAEQRSARARCRSALAERFPHLVEWVGSDTRDQMQVSDRLLIDRAITKIVDLGSGTFDLFFAVMAKIDFVPEARRQLVEQLFCSWPIGNRRPRALMLT